MPPSSIVAKSSGYARLSFVSCFEYLSSLVYYLLFILVAGAISSAINSLLVEPAAKIFPGINDAVIRLAQLCRIGPGFDLWTNHALRTVRGTLLNPVLDNIQLNLGQRVKSRRHTLFGILFNDPIP